MMFSGPLALSTGAAAGSRGATGSGHGMVVADALGAIFGLGALGAGALGVDWLLALSGCAADWVLISLPSCAASLVFAEWGCAPS